jgi:hypothetical protein
MIQTDGSEAAQRVWGTRFGRFDELTGMPDGLPGVTALSPLLQQWVRATSFVFSLFASKPLDQLKGNV